MPNTPVFAQAEEGANEDLLFMEVPGVIVPLTNRSQIPASVTTITAEDIQITPAKNIIDLIEVYVPGALWMNHSDGTQVGIRGVISDRRNKYLLLVNGRLMNVKGHTGIESELETWDKDDIEKIEIIRGPGSVTYGPGAIGGVISITLKNAITDPGFGASYSYTNKYHAMTENMHWGYNTKDYSAYLYASSNETTGVKGCRAYKVSSSTSYGYFGEQLSSTSNYFQNAYERPQLKLYADIATPNGWDFWLRYTQQGIPSGGYGSPSLTKDGIAINSFRSQRQFTAYLKNNRDLTDKLDLKSSLSWMSTDTESISARTYDLDREAATNFNWNYAEDSLLLKEVLSYSFNDKYSLAGGLSYEYNHWGPGWDDGLGSFIMGDSKNILGDARSYNASVSGTTPYYAYNGWSTHTLSEFVELNMAFAPWAQVIMSGRLDENTLSKKIFSPRCALVSDWGNFGQTKVIWQKSTRMGNMEQLFIGQITGSKPTQENCQGWEFIYTPQPIGKLQLSNSYYYNYMQVLSWNGTGTSLAGEGSMWGIEPEAKYTEDNWDIGINHSYLHMVNWQASSQLATNGISYSDYYKSFGSGMIARDYGDELNNWSKNTTKIFGNIKFFNKKVVFHADGQYFWDFEGVLDQMAIVEKASIGTAQAANVAKLMKDLRNKSVGEGEFKLNLSLGYKAAEWLTLTIYGQNIIRTNDGKRYYYDSGSLGSYAPSRISWVEDPRTFGFKIDVKF